MRLKINSLFKKINIKKLRTTIKSTKSSHRSKNKNHQAIMSQKNLKTKKILLSIKKSSNHSKSNIPPSKQCKIHQLVMNQNNSKITKIHQLTSKFSYLRKSNKIHPLKMFQLLKRFKKKLKVKTKKRRSRNQLSQSSRRSQSKMLSMFMKRRFKMLSKLKTKETSFSKANRSTKQLRNTLKL